ncbi:MAG TPA: glycine zipper 2TM domain-containing protein [Phenylobacterium sp.]|jgi:uncharacterized protein YcfJ|nr:glycine zipper 2TM domain-containing protein [Phenylobacterium sp.]
MRKIISSTAIAALAALPLLAGASQAAASCRGRANTGTAVGAVGGALLGNSISRGGGGAVIGGLGGAVLGHQIAKGGCHSSYTRHAYYRRHTVRHHTARVAYYDAQGRPVYR